MKPAHVAASALAALLAACGRQDGHAVAKVNGAPITQTEVAVELRNLLWRNGETWNALKKAEQAARRETALENLTDRRLLAEFTTRHPGDQRSVARETEEEFQYFLKQFAPPEEWRNRMDLQGLDEPALRKRIGEETGTLDAVERWLAQQPGRITEADARTWFEAHTDDLAIPERVRASHIFLTRHDRDKPDREAEIREIHRKLTAGEATFEELATRNSDDDSAKLRGGDLGWFTRSRVPGAFAEKVFALPIGEVSAPFESQLGWHILVVKVRRPARTATFEEAKGEIVAMLDREWREAAVRRLLRELRSTATIETFEGRITAISPE